MPSLLDALHDIIPSARNLFDWTDPHGRLLHYYVEGPLDTAAAQRYFTHFHNSREAACMPAFASLRETPAGVRSARDLDHPAFFSSALYNEVWRPQGLHTRIEGVVRSRSGRLLGSLVLYRGPLDAAFTAFDEGLLAALLPMIANALERCEQAAPTGALQAGGCGVHVAAHSPIETMVLDTDGRLVQATAGACKALLLAAGGPSQATLALAPQGLIDRLLGSIVHKACEQTRRAAMQAPHAQGRALVRWPSVSLFSAFGRFDAHAMPLLPLHAGAPPLVQVTLQQLEPRQVAVHRALRGFELSAGQLSIGAALYEGIPQADIARRLGVAPSTVVDHARKLYNALGVAGSAGLRALLDERLAAAAG